MQIVYKKAKASSLNNTSLKDAMTSNSKWGIWKGAMEIEYKVLLANKIWKKVDRSTYQHALTRKWVFKRKHDIND